MRKVFALTLRGEKYPVREYEWAGERIWVTEKQLTQMMRDQDNPERKGRIYWIGDRFFGLRDLAVAKPYDYDNPQIQFRIKDLDYLRKALEAEAAAK